MQLHLYLECITIKQWYWVEECIQCPSLCVVKVVPHVELKCRQHTKPKISIWPLHWCDSTPSLPVGEGAVLWAWRETEGGDIAPAEAELSRAGQDLSARAAQRLGTSPTSTHLLIVESGLKQADGFLSRISAFGCQRESDFSGSRF